ncbi:MAG: DNA gyrase inhibitor YacG [Rhodospirillales bacterium]
MTSPDSESDSASDLDPDPNPDSNAVPLRGRICPVCAKSALLAFKPFCSKRCADVDLGRWLGGSYAIPGRPVLEDPDADA